MALNIVEKIDGAVSIKRVLASVSDKTGLDPFVRGLLDVNPEVMIYSTGGTFEAIRSLLGPERATRNLTSVSTYTGQPEMQGGLVKTLDFKIYLGLLSETYNPSHAQDLERAGAVPIDMVVVNLYPFAQTIAKAGVTAEAARTNIDIGGPCMIRAAAKNYLRTASVTDPADYSGVLATLRANGGALPLVQRLTLMKKAFAHTAAYDKAIADYFEARAIAEVSGCYQIV